MAKVPGVAHIIALMRSISYIHFRPVGPIRVPSMKYVLVLGSFGVATIVWTFTIMPYYQSKFDNGGTSHTCQEELLTHDQHHHSQCAHVSTDLCKGTNLSALIAIALVPFIFVMALKINPVSLLTGISHAHLQTYHQGLAFFFVRTY